MDEFYSRTIRLLGEEAVDRLTKSRVAIFGIGGVGSFAVEALARAGIGKFLLVDADVVSVSNINRQLPALRSTVGKKKVDVMADRIHDINPNAVVEKRAIFYLPENADSFDLSEYDFIIDAVDTVAGKVELVVRAHQTGTPIVSCMGAGNKLDPTRFQVADIFKTSVCPLCRVMRKKLKEKQIPHLTVVYSQEPPPAPIRDVTAETARKVAPGSISFAPPVAGLILAGVVIRKLSGVEV